MSQNRSPKLACGYVLLTYGRKHTRVPLELRSGAYTQLRMISRYARKHGFRVHEVESEYVQNAERPADFETLFQLLERCKSQGDASVVILDDIERLMKRLPFPRMQGLAIELSPYLELIHDARLGQRLDEVDPNLWNHLVGIAQKQKIDAELTRRFTRRKRTAAPEQMRRAHTRSGKERAKRADQAASAIGALRNELLAENPERKLTFAGIARVANERGLRTTRGSEWTSARVSRALRRLEQHTSD